MKGQSDDIRYLHGKPEAKPKPKPRKKPTQKK